MAEDETGRLHKGPSEKTSEWLLGKPSPGSAGGGRASPAGPSRTPLPPLPSQGPSEPARVSGEHDEAEPRGLGRSGLIALAATALAVAVIVGGLLAAVLISPSTFGIAATGGASAQDLDALENAVADLDGRVAELESLTEGLETGASDLVVRLEELEARVEEAAARIDDLELDSGRLDDIESRTRLARAGGV